MMKIALIYCIILFGHSIRNASALLARTAMYFVPNNNDECHTQQFGYVYCASVAGDGIHFEESGCVYCYKGFTCDYYGDRSSATNVDCYLDLSHSTTSRPIPYQFMPQQCSDWCWAAFMATFYRYFNQEAHADPWEAQCTLVNEHFNRVDCCNRTTACKEECNQGAFSDEYVEVLNNHLNDPYRANIDGNHMVYGGILKNFQKNFALGVGMDLSTDINQQCHVAAFVGYLEMWNGGLFNTRDRVMKLASHDGFV
eukprot:76111_1